MGNALQRYGASLAIWDHSVTGTCHPIHPTQVNAPRHNPTKQAGTPFPAYSWVLAKRLAVRVAGRLVSRVCRVSVCLSEL